MSSDNKAHHPVDISELADQIVGLIESHHALVDIGTKQAALKVAVAVYEASVAAQSQAVMLHSILNGMKK